MQTSAAQPAPLSATGKMTKAEVCEYLGKSKRTVETYIADGRLAAEYFNGPNGKQASFDRATVEALRRDMDTPMVRAVADTGRAGSASLARIGETAVGPHVPKDAAAFQHFLAGVLQAFPIQRPWLTLEEAAEFSGFPKSWLLAQARNRGTKEPFVYAINIGSDKRASWRFSRAALAQDRFYPTA